jgi:hypothetical protein
VQYDNACTASTSNTDNSLASSCKVTFTLTDTLKAPVYLYYGFKGFYQNHRRYLKYFSNSQLTAGDPYASSVHLSPHRPAVIAAITILMRKHSDPA